MKNVLYFWVATVFCLSTVFGSEGTYSNVYLHCYYHYC